MDASELLDQLSEFQAQADYLELRRKELLDGVQVPAEILSAQDAANKERKRVDTNLYGIQRAIEIEKIEAIAAIEMPAMPPEYLAAMEAVNKYRAALNAEYSARIESAQTTASALKAQIEAELKEKTSEVYAQVQARKNEINAEFSGQAEAVKENIEALTKRIKDEVKQAGQSVKGSMFHAVYVKGRTSWNTDMLDGMIIAFPALEKARKVGEPSVTIRKI